jgi:hypothetical protein
MSLSGQLHLGEMLAFKDQSSVKLGRWLAGADALLAAEVGEQAALRGETLAQFVRIAVSDFLAEADEEAWADLISALRDDADPGLRCVRKMAAFRIRLERAA